MAVGRKQVAPRQTIASQWGNWVWDQSVQSFATKADRDSQFPSPQRGACCTIDAHPGLFFQYDGAKWMTQQALSIVVTTNGFGTALAAFPAAFAARPISVSVNVEATASPDDYVATIDQNNLSAINIAAIVQRITNGTPIANTAVVLHYRALGQL